MSKGRAVGGYVRPCERKPCHEPRDLGWSSPFEMFYQVMPVLSSVPFDVSEPVDKPGMQGLRSKHEQRHHPVGS